MNSISILGCGWLGFPLAIEMINKGWEVKGTTTTPDKIQRLKEEGISPFLFNIYQKETWASEFFDCDVILLNVPPGRRNPTVLEDFPRAMNLVISEINQKSKILLVSSTSVYGGTKGKVTEKTAKEPTTASGKALDRVEEELIARFGKNSTILRPSGLVGGQRHPIRQLSGRKGLSNGAAPLNLIHRKDVLTIIHEVINQQVWGETFNLSTDTHPGKGNYYSWAAEQLGLEKPEFIDEGGDGKWISNQKIKSKLGIELAYPHPKDFLLM